MIIQWTSCCSELPSHMTSFSELSSTEVAVTFRKHLTVGFLETNFSIAAFQQCFMWKLLKVGFRTAYVKSDHDVMTSRNPSVSLKFHKRPMRNLALSKICLQHLRLFRVWPLICGKISLRLWHSVSLSFSKSKSWASLQNSIRQNKPLANTCFRHFRFLGVGWSRVGWGLERGSAFFLSREL